MKLKEKLNMTKDELVARGPITIVAFGDSVTHGCMRDNIDYENVYWNVLKKKLNAVRDSIPVNVINAGIGGLTAERSLPRLQRDVLSHHPDLVIVCFGLNDVNTNLDSYLNALKIIFTESLASGAEVIFMTPNMLNTYVAEDVADCYRNYAGITMQKQNNGDMDLFMDSATALAKECKVTVCDCYSKWKQLQKDGVDTTRLLINRINHPTPKMHGLFAEMLLRTIMEDDTFLAADAVSSMFCE